MSDISNAKKKASMNGEVDTNFVVDAVFVIGTGSQNDNEELKYALRNLERNCPFIRDVYISGECPAWVNTSVVKHLKWPDRFSHAKDANIIDKLRHACECPGISKNILFCSDDQFVTRVCSWKDFAPRWLRQYKPTDDWYENRNRVWHTRLHKTLDRDRRRRLVQGLNPNNVYYYQPHIWMPIDRDSFIEYAKWSDYEHREDTIIASGYFNYVDAKGEFNYDHEFIVPNQKWPVKATHIAYSDSSFESAMEYLKKEFPLPSKFEIDSIQKRNNIKITRIEPEITPMNTQNQAPLPRERIIELINNEPLWENLVGEVNIAETLRKRSIEGWEEVWDDLAARWSSATDNGTLLVPVTEHFPPEIIEIIKKYAKSTIGKTAEPTAESAVKVAQPRKCSACEAARQKQNVQVAKMSPEEFKKTNPDAKFVTLSAQPAATLTARENRNDLIKIGAGELEACADCAMDHLSVAIAYLNSNAATPDFTNVVLAKGEVTVAAKHLQALGHEIEYLNCLEAIESINSEHSLFSASTITDILRRVIEHYQ